MWPDDRACELPALPAHVEPAVGGGAREVERHHGPVRQLPTAGRGYRIRLWPTCAGLPAVHRCARGVICSQALSARPMQPHEGWSPEPDPGERERQRQRTLTIRLLLVIAVLLGAITPMLLWWLLS